LDMQKTKHKDPNHIEVIQEVKNRNTILFMLSVRKVSDLEKYYFAHFICSGSLQRQ